MKSKIIGLLVVGASFFSCSSDNDGGSDRNNGIVGIWDATELVIDADTASEDAVIGSQILRFLSNNDCSIITLTFNEDLTAQARNGIVQAIATATFDPGAGLVVPCPTDYEVVSNTYTFNNGIISFLNDDGETVNVMVSINGDTMTVDAQSLGLPEVNEPGELIFTRR